MLAAASGVSESALAMIAIRKVLDPDAAPLRGSVPAPAREVDDREQVRSIDAGNAATGSTLEWRVTDTRNRRSTVRTWPGRGLSHFHIADIHDAEF
jgi:hypothetical protein